MLISLQVDLAARVTQLEAQLRAQFETNVRRSSAAISSDTSDFSGSHVPQKRKLPTSRQTELQHTAVCTSGRIHTESGVGDDQHWYVSSAFHTISDVDDTIPNMRPIFADSSSFATPPPAAILEHLVDVYFLNCHCQPYSFFHEAILRRQLLVDEVPEYLQLAIASTAVRYSKHEYFKDSQAKALRAYARSSWLILLERFFTSDNHPNVTMAQATALLAVTDFVGE